MITKGYHIIRFTNVQWERIISNRCLNCDLCDYYDYYDLQYTVETRLIASLRNMVNGFLFYRYANTQKHIIQKIMPLRGPLGADSLPLIA